MSRIVIQTRPRAPLNVPPVFVQWLDPLGDTYQLTTVAADATTFSFHTEAWDWLDLHPELAPGIVFVKWVI